MKRIDIVFQTLKNLDKGLGVTTSQLSEKLNLERSNISKDLNILVLNNKVFKQISRPVKYFISNPYISNKSINKSKIDILSMLYPSLEKSITLSKTAIMYPPSGMNSLIIGDTGVGKSMLAKLMHEYACDLKNKKISYIHFNCSDYCANPQLLVSHLFGVKKGTFTGASTDKIGLLEKADNGIIFLDEIHNLTNEGQEMLFLYMDTGYFRRLGEVSEKRKSSALIICATNKDINTHLLATFTRRIPIKIDLPSLEERNLHERLTLIELFLKEESKKINEDIFISKNALLSLMLYKCLNNIGQLKNDITLAIANSYFEYIARNKKHIKINRVDLTKHVTDKETFNTQNEVKALKLLEKIGFDKDNYALYNNTTDIIKYGNVKIIDDIINSFSNMIISIYTLPKSKNYQHTNDLFSAYITTLKSANEKYHFRLDNTAFQRLLVKLTSYDIELTNIFDFEKVFKMHIDMIYDRLEILNIAIKPLLLRLNTLYPKTYNIALNLSSDIEYIYNATLSDIEILSIFLFLQYFKFQKL